MEWKKLLCSERIRKSSGRGADLRSEFEKDYHRIISSASFRRLQDKTQVFPLDKSDFVRTRLTHSLEVSSFGRSLGKCATTVIMRDGLDGDFLPRYSNDICDILSCAGLIHDIGNPPFGHFGETVIRKWFKKNLPLLTYKGRLLNDILSPQMIGDFYNYEGNAQALRLVTKLHYVVDFHGMNLTKGLLSACIKYPCFSTETDLSKKDKTRSKMGVFYSEKEIFEDIDSSCGTEGKRNPLVFLLEAADDIAYKTADIEDAFKKGLISFGELKAELGEYGKLLINTSGEYKAVQNFIVDVQRKALNAAAESFGRNYSALMNGEFKTELLSGTAEGEILSRLGDIAYKYAFSNRQIYLLELGADNIISTLLNTFVPAVLETDDSDGINMRVFSLISENYRKACETYSKDKPEGERIYLRLMLACDYISGMTDSFARGLYREIKGV